MISQASIIIEELLNKAKEDNSVYFVYMDGYGTLVTSLKENFPDRVIACGISEQNAVSLASGLALSGKKVYLFGCGLYMSARPFEQVRIDCAYNNANVKILGIQSGLACIASGGYSHWGIEDIALMRVLPNMSVVSPGSLDETKQLINHSHEGPMYIRLDNVFVNHFAGGYGVEFAKLSTIVRGQDFCIIATGNSLPYAFDLVQDYKAQGKKPMLLSAHTLKPFDEEKISEIIDVGMPIVTIEEHGVGGLGSIVAEVIAKSGRAVKFLPIYIKDCPFNLVGNYDYIVEKLMELSTVKTRIDDLLRAEDAKPLRWQRLRNSIRIELISTKHDFKKGRKEYLLFNLIPLLKIKRRTRVKKGKPDKYYLFGFIRVR